MPTEMKKCVRTHKFYDLVDVLLFIYFFTLHADQLSLNFGGFTLRINNLIAIFLLTCFLMRFRDRQASLNRELLIGLLIIGISLLLSFLNSPYQNRCLFFLGFYSLIVICYVLLPYWIACLYGLEKLMKLYMISYLFVGSYALLQLIVSLIGFSDPFAEQILLGKIARPNAFAYEPSYYALYMTPFVMMANFHYLYAPASRFFCIESLTLKKVMMINLLYLISTSTGAMFAYIIFFVLLVLLLPFGMHKTMPGFSRRVCCFALLFSLLLVVVGMITPFLIKDFLLKFLFAGFKTHHSFFERWAGIVNTWKLFCDHPFLGVGLGGVPPYLYEAWLHNNGHYTFISTELLTKADLVNPMKIFEPTNVLTEVLASLGIIGLLAFFSLFYVFFKQLKHAYAFNPALALNILISTAVLLCVLQFNQGLLRTYVWVHFALMFSLLERKTAGSFKKIINIQDAERV